MKQDKENSLFSRISRSAFLRTMFFVLGAMLFPFACKNRGRKHSPPAPKAVSTEKAKVYLVKNGTVEENINKLLEMIGGISKYVQPSDVVVLKCNAQWPKQGYTNTECIKYVIDAILALPGFSGEVLICDNIQNTGYTEKCGFIASSENREHNWAEHNWESLAQEYQSKGSPVATVRWQSSPVDKFISGPADGPGWTRDFFPFKRHTVYLSYPVFKSPLTPGRLIDMKNGIWESGKYTGRRVRAIFMPTLNNHGFKSKEDYAGITSAIKCFFGATEIHTHDDATVVFNGQKCLHIHSASYTGDKAYYAGNLVARYIKTMYSPVLYITCAIWTGYESRIGAAEETKTVLACENPVSLDYISSKLVISPYAPWLDPDKNNNTRRQISGCAENGIGTMDPDMIEVISHNFG